MRRLLLALTVLLSVAIAAALAAVYLADDIPRLSAPKVLVWHLDEPLADYRPRPSWPFPSTASGGSLIDVYAALSAAARDDSLDGVALYIHDTRFGLAKAQQIRRLLADLRQTGKLVECYLETAGEGTNGTLAYYLAAACERIHLTPAADLDLLGLMVDRLYLRGTLDKLEIDPDFLWIGRYKSAVESYTQEEASEAADEALGAVLDDYYDALLGAIGADRGLDPAELEAIVDRAPFSAAEALELGLVDELSYPDEFEDHLEERLGEEPEMESLAAYLDGRRGGGGRRVAVVFAQGAILRGASGVDPWTAEIYVGSRDLGAVLADLREDDGVAAVVLRIDSPGGSALASDLILREVELLADAKPLVVSMSDVAASGGYYIATKAGHIVAEETTLTGSIGVYGGKLVTRRFERELLGFTHDPMKRGANADIYSALEPFSPAQAERVTELMERVYERFVGHVASGREMSAEAVEEVAQGRIWTGRQAVAIGLVDEVGGFERAFAAVRRNLDLAEDAPLALDLYPRPPALLDYLLGRARPFLPLRFLAPLEALDEDHFRLLEMPPELTRLANPF